MKKSLDWTIMEEFVGRLTDLWENENWQKVNHHDKTNGLSQKAVNSYRREHPGSKLKTAVTTKPSKLKPGSKAAKRRKSFCARMSGNKGPMKKPNGKPTPKALALRRWNCESIEEMQQMILEGEQMIAKLRKQTTMKATEFVTEKWTKKYKSSINCSHPKGFSQRAHCAGKKKHTESMMTMEATCPDCGMCQTHGNLNEIAKGAKDSNGFTKCWPGKHAEGTKKGRNGGQVRNCVPNEGVAEGGVLKSIKRGIQGWGRDELPITGTANKPKDVVARAKSYDIDTAKMLRKGLDDAPEHTPAGLQKRVLDRKLKGVAEGSEQYDEISDKAFDEGYAGYSYRNVYPKGTREYEEYHEGWYDGRLAFEKANDYESDFYISRPEQGVAEGSENNNITAQKIFFARSNKTPKGWSYDHVGFITQDGRQIQMSGHKGNDVYVTNDVTDDPEFPKQNIKIVSLSKPVSVPTTNSVGAENCGTFVANVLQANGIKGIDTQYIYSVFKKPQEQGVAEGEKHGLYYNVNKRKAAGTSRPASSPKAPTAQAWKDAAKTAKTEGAGAQQAAIAIAKKKSGNYTKTGQRKK